MNERNWKKIMIVSLVLVVLLLSGFSAVTGSATAAEPVKAKGGVLKIAMQQDLPNYNYWDLSSNTVWKSNVIGWNFESLIGMDYDGSAFPVLAESYEFDTENLTATLHLRHGVTFQDGEPMTAKDVVFSYCALRQGTTVSGTSYTIPFDDNGDGTVSYDEIKNHVKYVDDYTVKISARQAYSFFFLGTLGLPIIPEHIWKDHLVDVDGQGVAVDEQGYTHGIVDVTWNSDPKATIGTGWWMYGGGVRDSYRVEVPYENYWGKDFKTPNGYPFYNENVTQLYFKVYSNLDTAILALETGEVDYIAWTIEPGKVPLLQKDPNIDLHFLSDRGYFYLAFNQKTMPANYISFRHAVSHVIDKKAAVERYLGGYGQPGDAANPPFFDAWYNSSVQHYPYDLNTAKKILDGERVIADNGYVEQDPAWGQKFVDQDGDGWRDLPDGSPMQPITLFTPPADYDPVRIKVGQGIAQNLRKLGINIVAKPVDFDTLVAYMQSYNYQMLELGWLLSTDPIGNLADIYGPKSIQNTYGWWNASDPNPYYVDAGGVHNTLADKYSQDLATEFDQIINKAMTTFDVNEQIKYTKWAEDIIAKAVVCNILYYRLNVEATRKSWQGWVEWQGSVYNGLSLGLLHKGGIGGGVQTGKYLDMGVNVPGKVLVGNTVTGNVFVANSNGKPMAGAKIEFKPTNGLVSITPKGEYTDNNGMLEFSLTADKAGFEVLNITASYGDYKSVTKSVVVQLVGAVPKLLTMNVEADKYSLSAGDKVNVTVTVEDENGAPVEGAVVSVDTELVGYGTITPENATTNAHGVATFTYTAPSEDEMKTGKYANMHTIAKFVFDVAKEGYDLTNTVILQLVTYNKYTSVWDIVRVQEVTNWTVNQTSLQTLRTDVHILAFDVDGNPLANKKIALTYSNESYLNNPPTEVSTDAHGWANISLQFKADLPTKVVRIHAAVVSGHSVGDSIDILYWNPSRPADVPLYGGHVYIDPFMDQGGLVSASVELYNQTNQHPSGVQNVSIVISATPDGQLVYGDDDDGLMYHNMMNTADEYVGINIYGDYSDSVLGTAGLFYGALDKTKSTVSWLDWGTDLSDYGYPSAWNKETTWDYLYLFYSLYMESFPIKDGVGGFYLEGDRAPYTTSSYRDLVVKVYVVTNGITYYITDPSVNNFVMYGNQTFESEFAVQRAMTVIITSYQLSSPYVWSGDTFNVLATTYNESNAIVPMQSVVAYNNAKSWKALYSPGVGHSTPTDSDEIIIPINETNQETNMIYFKGPVVPGTVHFTWTSGGVTYTGVDSPRYPSLGLLLGYTYHDPFGITTFHLHAIGIIYYQAGLAILWFNNDPFGAIDDPAIADMYTNLVVDYDMYVLSATDEIATDGVTTSYDYTLSTVPVEPNTVTVTWYLSGLEMSATDDGTGNITGTGINGTIDYETGDVNLTFDQAPDLGFIMIGYSFDPAQTAVITVKAPVQSSAGEVDVYVEAADLRGRASASPWFGEYHILEATQIPVVPHQLFVSAEVTSYMVDLGGTVAFKATVTDENGKSFDATVSATSTDGNIISVGGNEFILDTSGMDVPNVLNPVEVTLTINGVDGYLVGATKVTVLVRNMPPSLTISSVGNGDVIYANSLTLSGYAYDSNGVDSVFVTVDGGSPQAASISVVPGGVQWSLDLSELSEGNHTITVVAEDSQGVQQSQTVTFEVKLINGQSDLPSVVQDMQSGMSNNAMLGYTGIILAIIALIIAIVAVLKKPKAPVVEEEAEEVPEETEEEVTEEEEVEEVPEETEEEVTEEEAEEEETPKEGGEE